MNLCIVVPVYRNEQTLRNLYDEVAAALIDLNWELMFVNDGSPDNSLLVLNELSNQDSRVKVLNLSRNFGQHAAISAGISEAKADIIVVMDADLQHNPSYIPILLEEKQKQKVDIVFTYVNKRKFGFIKNIGSILYSFFYRLLTGDNISYSRKMLNFCLMSSRAAKAFNSYPEVHRHFLFIVRSLGFKTRNIMVDHRSREIGESSYTFIKLLDHAINGLISSSTRILYLITGIGIVLAMISLIIIFLLFLKYYTGSPQPGWVSQMAIVTFFSGVIVFFQGVVGLFVGKMFEQVRSRPIYIIADKINF